MGNQTALNQFEQDLKAAGIREGLGYYELQPQQGWRKFTDYQPKNQTGFIVYLTKPISFTIWGDQSKESSFLLYNNRLEMNGQVTSPNSDVNAWQQRYHPRHLCIIGVCDENGFLNFWVNGQLVASSKQQATSNTYNGPFDVNIDLKEEGMLLAGVLTKQFTSKQVVPLTNQVQQLMYNAGLQIPAPKLQAQIIQKQVLSK